MKSTNTNRKEQQVMEKTTEKTTFKDLLTSFEKSVHDHIQTPTTDTEKAYTDTLQELATAVAYSVLKKCIDVSLDKNLIQVKRDLARDTAALKNLRYTSNNEKIAYYNANGERKEKNDKDLHNAFSTLASETLGDGIDLVNVAVVSILTEMQKATKRNSGALPIEWIEAPYTTRHLKKKVYIQSKDSVDGWEDYTTTPIQEVYKAVRRYIQDSESIKTASFEYLYIDEMTADPNSGMTDIVYRRLTKYADVGGAVTDFNGKEIAYVAEREKIDTTDSLIEKLNLTARQTQVLKLRLSGYGYKAIGTYLGIDHSNVVRVCKQIQQKALNVGFKPDTI